MSLNELLIVEDKEEHIQDIREKIGNVKIVQTLSEFEREITQKQPKYVLSDLYFPTGYTKEEALKQESIKIIKDYIILINPKDNPIGTALELILKNENIEDIGEFFKRHGNDEIIKKYENLIRNKYKTQKKVNEYKELILNIENNTHELPSGIFVYKICKEKNIPCIIVTDSYHHGTDFQPFVDKVGTYFDQLKNDKKQWKEALEKIMEKEK